MKHLVPVGTVSRCCFICHLEAMAEGGGPAAADARARLEGLR